MSVNKPWSEEATEKLLQEYNGVSDNERLDEIAEMFGKTVPAIRSKLVSLKVYEKNPARSVGGASSVRKAHIVRKIANALGTEGLDSLEKASKQDLEKILSLVGTSAE